MLRPWLLLPVVMSALLLARTLLAILPEGVSEWVFSYPSMMALVGVCAVLHARYPRFRMRTLCEALTDHLWPAVIRMVREAIKWLVHYGDLVPVAKFRSRQELRRAFIRFRRSKKSAPATMSQSPRRASTIADRRLGAMKRHRRSRRRWMRLLQTYGRPPPTQGQMDSEQKTVMQDANEARVSHMTLDLELCAANNDAMHVVPYEAQAPWEGLEPVPPESSAREPTSWRNPESPWYRTPRQRLWNSAFRTVVMAWVLLLLVTMSSLVIPIMASPTILSSMQQAAASAGHVNYLAAEVKEQQLEQLQQLKGQPHDPPALTGQYTHGINCHLPASVATRVDPERYHKDPECGLVIERVDKATDDQFGQMRDMLREMAPKVVAYSIDQLTGYKDGVEGPMKIDLNTTSRIFAPARRAWERCRARNH